MSTDIIKSWNNRRRVGEILVLFGIAVILMMPVRVVAVGLFDGGMLNGIDSQCSCSGGQTIKVQSYVDDSTHVYMYQPGVTQLFMNYGLQKSGNYFMTTLVPFAVCLDASEDCEGSSGQPPEGIFVLVGTSFKGDTNSFAALLQNVSKIPFISRTISQLSPSIPWRDTRL